MLISTKENIHIEINISEKHKKSFILKVHHEYPILIGV